MSLHEVKSEVSPSLLRQAADKWENLQSENAALRYLAEEKTRCIEELCLRLNDTEERLRKALYELEAEADGRRVVLPCKVGDLVWGIRVNHGRKDGKMSSAKPVQLPVNEMYFGDDMRLCVVLKGCCRGEWGKSVFGSEAEARKHLEALYEYSYGV